MPYSGELILSGLAGGGGGKGVSLGLAGCGVGVGTLVAAGAAGVALAGGAAGARVGLAGRATVAVGCGMGEGIVGWATATCVGDGGGSGEGLPPHAAASNNRPAPIANHTLPGRSQANRRGDGFGVCFIERDSSVVCALLSKMIHRFSAFGKTMRLIMTLAPL